MTTEFLTEEIIRIFPYAPTAGQKMMISELARFVLSREPSQLFIFKGYAGTGKTTIISSLVRVLKDIRKKPVLLAPTGRAAKVLMAYSGEKAFTIHKKIYRLHEAKGEEPTLVMQINKHQETLFIVDEASMIQAMTTAPSKHDFGISNLLDDLIQYVYSGMHCRLILLGDTAQLPPVHSPQSLALEEEFLRKRYQLDITSREITEVVRQELESGILHNATTLREHLQTSGNGFPRFSTSGFNDFVRLQGHDAYEYVQQAFDTGRPGRAVVICRSNKRANQYNKNIRQAILFRENEIDAGDRLMVTRNNYFWLPADSDAGFIANGDIIEIRKIRSIENKYGFRFANIYASLIDYEEEPDLECKVMLDTLESESPALDIPTMRGLIEAISKDGDIEQNHKNSLYRLNNNPYFQALQIKFAYALTCHKAQGGQWEEVFVDMGMNAIDQPNTEYIRWLYTAVTRATQRLYLLNFSDKFFE